MPIFFKTPWRAAGKYEPSTAEEPEAASAQALQAVERAPRAARK
jgi:hypothetical protein